MSEDHRRMAADRKSAIARRLTVRAFAPSRFGATTQPKTTERAEPNMRKTIATLAFALLGLASSASAQTSVNADVVANTTWSGEIVLQRPIFVKNGAILTILPGTIVRGQPRSGPVVAGQTVGSPGALIVTQNGRIVADADPANPIIMTTAAVDNNDDGIADDIDANGFEDAWVLGDTFLDDLPKTQPLAPLDKSGNNSNVALWGGLVVLGNAPTNLADKCGVGYGKCTIEGLTIPGFPAADATYGGVNPNDNSGILEYVSVRHAGDEIGSGNELNGITLGAVGTGTSLAFLEVYANFDDGIEWFGGTANGMNLHVAYVGDDGIDVDEGYTGVNQFVFIVHPFFKENDGGEYGSASGDKLGELDGDNYRPDNVAHNDNVNRRVRVDLLVFENTPWPLSNFQFHNLTAIGSTPDAGADFTPVVGAGTNRGLQFRNGSAGGVFSSIIVNTGAETGIEVDTTVGAGAPGFDAINNVNAGLINLVCSTLDDGAALAAQETTAVTNGNALAVRLGGVAPATNNVVNSALFPNLIDEDTTFNPTGNAAGKLDSSLKPTPINPRPGFGLTGVGGCPQPYGKLLANATYRGAFDRGAAVLWTTDWTVLNIAGLLAD
jgi:hypothetical protein